jgi:carboxymethylenebutenolidase
VRAARTWLAGQPHTSRGRVGAIGFGRGGEHAIDLALRDPTIAAIVLFYGPPAIDLARLEALGAPFQGHFAAEDPGVPPGRVGQLERALKRGGRTAEIHVYAAARAGFMDEDGPASHADATRQAWARLLAFLQKHLKG